MRVCRFLCRTLSCCFSRFFPGQKASEFYDNEVKRLQPLIETEKIQASLLNPPFRSFLSIVSSFLFLSVLSNPEVSRRPKCWDEKRAIGQYLRFDALRDGKSNHRHRQQVEGKVLNSPQIVFLLGEGEKNNGTPSTNNKGNDSKRNLYLLSRILNC